MQSADDFDRHVGAFRELLDQLEMMGIKDSEIHVYRTFKKSLTSAFKAKAWEFEKEQVAKEGRVTAPSAPGKSRLDRLITYLSNWISHLSPSSSTEVAINHLGGQERTTKKRRQKTRGKGLCRCCGAAWDRTHFCAQAAEKYGKFCSRCGKDQLAFGRRCPCWAPKGGQSTSLQHCEVAVPEGEFISKVSGDRSGTGELIEDKPEPPLESKSNNTEIVEESHSTAALTKAGVHDGDCVSKDRDLYHLQESKKGDKGLIFSFEGYIKGRVG